MPSDKKKKNNKKNDKSNDDDQTIISGITYSKEEKVKILSAKDVHRILSTILRGESPLERDREHFLLCTLEVGF